MSSIDQLLIANNAYASTFAHGELPSPPSRRVAIVTCMDARLVPSRALGLEEGEAHVIRNAGGCAREAVRSLAVSQHLLGTTEVALIRHTDCGMAKYSNEQIQAKVADACGADTSGVDFRPFSELEQAVRDDVSFLEGCDLIADDAVIRGFVYDVKTGALTEVR
jgi:carbonic anhydrase